MKVCSLKLPNIPLPCKHKNPLYRSLAISAYFLLLTALIPALIADDFGQGDLKFHINFVPIASNEPSTDYFGESMPHTDYDYRISKTEISIAQFLQARAADPRISRSGINFWNSGRIKYDEEGDNLKFGVHAPVTFVNIIECFKFCNWLTSGDPYQGAYKIIKNQNPENDFLNVKDYVDVTTALTKYSTVYTVPTFIEWSKAAFFKPDGSGFSFYTNGSGSGNVFTKYYYNPKFFEEFGENPKDITFTTPSPSEANIRYVDKEGEEQIITPPKGVGGWNSNFQPYPWPVGSSAREQNGTYDMFGNVGEYYQNLIDLDKSNGDFKIQTSCWNLDTGYTYLGGNEYPDLGNTANPIEAFSTFPLGYKISFLFESANGGYKNLGFRIVARGAIPSASSMPEVQSTITEGAANLHWDSTVGRIYQLQYSDSLDNPNWIDIGQQIHGSGGTDFFTIPVNTTAEKNRAYRVVDFD